MGLTDRLRLADLNYDQPHGLLQEVVANVEKVIVGKSDAVRLCLVAFLSGGHV